MSKEKVKATHGFFNNMKFMFREQWIFQKKAFVSPIIFILFDLIVSLIAIWLPKLVLDMINHSISPSIFVMNICLVTGALMILKFFSYYSQQDILKNTVRILNTRFYIEKDRKILDMDYSISSSPEGKIMIEKGHNTTNRNILVNMASFYPKFTDFVKSIIGLLSFSAIILVLHPIVIVILLVSYLADACIAFVIQRWEHTLKDYRARIENKLFYILEMINTTAYAKDIRIYGMKDWIHLTAKGFIDEKEALESRVENRHLMQRLFEVLLFLLRNGGGYLFLIWRMLTTDMSIGDFTLFFSAITGFAQWLEQIVVSFKGLSNANFQIDDYRFLLDTKDVMKREPVAALPDREKPVTLTLENVSFRYGNSSRLILDRLNLHVKEGEKLAIVGANGAGKTTLVKLICGLLQPTEGRILLNGTDIREFNRDDYYQMITAVFQNVSLLPMSISQNVTFRPREGYDEEKLKSSLLRAGIYDRIAKLPNGWETELLPNVTERGVNLSGGELQRLMLARALYKDAPLLILDEPTAALDPIAENRMYQKYHDLTQNKTSVFISHRLSSTRFCDRIIFLEHGSICEMGTHDELIALGGRYKSVFDIQSHYYKENKEAVQ